MKIRNIYTCPVELVIDMLSGKWKTIILWRLRLGEQRSSSIYKDINGISEKMFIEHIHELVTCGFVQKNAQKGYPLVVYYSLTELGKDVIKGLEIFQDIGKKLLEKDIIK